MAGTDGPITELLWEHSMNSSQDEEIGSTDEMGWYCLFRGPLSPDEIDDHNEIVLDLERQQEAGYRWHLMRAADIYTAMTAAGFIVKQHSSGAVYSDVYMTNGDLEAAWAEKLSEYTIEECPECEASAEEYGIGMPIVHEDDCPTREEGEEAA